MSAVVSHPPSLAVSGIRPVYSVRDAPGLYHIDNAEVMDPIPLGQSEAAGFFFSFQF
jgi:hypothetical protein